VNEIAFYKREVERPPFYPTSQEPLRNSCDNRGENPELRIFDITGKEHAKIALQQKMNGIELNTSAYPEGIYLLKVTTVDSSKTLRFSIQK